MEERRTGLFENGLIWFGAGVSIAEILTGTYLAPLGFEKGLLAIIVGHIIGCLMFFAAGVIGGKVRKSSMETVKMSFGQKGSLLFSVLNVLQLVGVAADESMTFGAAGFVIYRILMNIDMPVGNTLPDMLLIIFICVAVAKITGAAKKPKNI